ncbi:MAG: hypothetical protein JXA10_03085 [Anaerolineae bacterium]|nr:hypothetical protein [Anaerolineae bacterium]
MSFIFLIAAALTGAVPVTRAQNPVPDNEAGIVIGLTDFPRSLDPGEVYDFGAWEILSHLYTGLTRQIPGTADAPYQYELALAEDVQISEDRLTYTFTLRDDTTFADGTPITAHTFVTSIERVLALRSAAAQAITPYVASITADDSHTLTFTLTRPTPYFLALVALPPYFPQHPDLARTERSQDISADVIGNGPYTLAQVTVQREIVLQANPTYQYAPQPQTDTIILRYYTRSQELRDAIRTHEIDLAWRALYTGHLIELEKAEIDGLCIIEQPSTRVFYLLFNQTREPFNDPRTRAAITQLIERGNLAHDTERNHMSALTSPVPAEFADAYAPIWPDEFALEPVDTALHAAGYRTREQTQLQFEVGYSQQTYGLWHTNTFTQLIRRYLNESDYINAGLMTDIAPSTLITQMERGTFGPAIIFAWTPPVPHPAAYLYPLAHPAESIPQHAGYATPEIARLLDEAARLADTGDQGVLYRAVAAQLLADHALVPLFQDHVVVIAWADISGIQVAGNFFLHYDRLRRE